MDKITLKASKRSKKAKPLVKAGIVPVVLYGYKIKETESLEVDAKDFSKVYKEAGESTIVDLDVDGKVTQVLVKDIQRDPVKDNFIHVDFYAIQLDKEITAEVELVYSGTSKAVKNEGGVLVRNITKVEVTALPLDLPKEIKVDISSLDTFEDVITIKDLLLPENAKLEKEPEEIVATVTPPRSEEELAELEEAVEEDVEGVEGVKKEEGEEGEEGEVAEGEEGAEGGEKEEGEAKEEAPAKDDKKEEK